MLVVYVLDTSITHASPTRRILLTNSKRSGKTGRKKHTTVGIRMWSPTILLTYRRVA
ncbi:hypothetical protein BJY00DRAFT_290964 [Aspergillus carlsbadensis]|nr:hypothetical protein BJY00DRAFT_290964 [Aspergillus carlsbadensis]